MSSLKVETPPGYLNFPDHYSLSTTVTPLQNKHAVRTLLTPHGDIHPFSLTSGVSSIPALTLDAG